MTWKYIAGFFDGEGSVTHNGRGYRVTISQTSLPVLKRIQQYAGIGKIVSVKKRKHHWRDAWIYYIAKQADVQKFLHACYPYLMVKRLKVKDTLSELPAILTNQQRRAKISNQHKQQVHKLREQGLSWRSIGEQVGIDWGYARRLYLRTKNHTR